MAFALMLRSEIFEPGGKVFTDKISQTYLRKTCPEGAASCVQIGTPTTPMEFCALQSGLWAKRADATLRPFLRSATQIHPNYREASSVLP